MTVAAAKAAFCRVVVTENERMAGLEEVGPLVLRYAKQEGRRPQCWFVVDKFRYPADNPAMAYTHFRKCSRDAPAQDLPLPESEVM